MQAQSSTRHWRWLGWIFLLAIMVGLFLLLLPVPGLAMGKASARSAGMGEAHLAMATGVDAARYNPANLGLFSHRATCLQLAGFGGSITNNAFTLSDYNRYNGSFLSQQDKDAILGKIPDEGLKLMVDAEAGALSVSSGAFAVTMTGVAQADVNLSRDLFELVLEGNTFADTIDVSSSYSDFVSYATIGVSYGFPLTTVSGRTLAVGGTARYLRGLAVERVIDMKGLISTEWSGFAGQGNLTAQTATGGSGYSLDLGAVLDLGGGYTSGLTLENVYGTISWTRGTEEHRYTFAFDTTAGDVTDENYVTSNDTTLDIASFSTALPPVMRAGLAWSGKKLSWALDYTQGLRSQWGASTTPRIGAGVEWTGLRLIPVRLGFATGGRNGTLFAFGSGLTLSAFHLDLAIQTGSSLSAYSTRGANLAVTTGLWF